MMTERDTSTVVWPTYALRAWLTALLGQTQRARTELDARIEYYEKEITHLRVQRERSATVIGSLREAIDIVDNVLYRARDTEVERESAQPHSETPANSPEKEQQAPRRPRTRRTGVRRKS
jgi:hypothetical protein